MNKTIEISSITYDRLAQYAGGFENPNDVIKKLLDGYEQNGVGHPIRHEIPRVNGILKTRDTTKYSITGEPPHLLKGKLVLAVLTDYVNKHPSVSSAELLEIFPKKIQGTHEVFREIEDARGRCSDPEKRYFMQPDKHIKLSDCVIVVCTQWAIEPNNIGQFIRQAEAIGYTITTDNRWPK